MIIILNQVSDVGEELCANPLVKKLSFTGSTNIGGLLTKQCAATLKKLSLELGGNSLSIVFDDVDVGKASSGNQTKYA